MSMNVRRKWTKNEIELLKQEFKSGTQIKIIASKFGKSETAVNKILTRYGIRPRKRHSIKYNSKVHKSTNYNIAKSRWLNILNDMVDFREVIKYLKSKNYKISNIIPDSMKILYPNSQYILNGYPVSKAKLLILANKLREEENKTCFKMDCLL